VDQAVQKTSAENPGGAILCQVLNLLKNLGCNFKKENGSVRNVQYDSCGGKKKALEFWISG